MKFIEWLMKQPGGHWFITLAGAWLILIFGYAASFIDKRRSRIRPR